jgi:hypothetical protein
MPGPSTSSIIYDFQYGERHSYDVFPASDIDLRAQDRPGIYAWYMRILPSSRSSDDLSMYANVFSARVLDVQASAPLGELYLGTIQRVSPFAQTLPSFIPITSTATTVFSPPLYIGLSNTILSRLRQHKSALEQFLRQPSRLTDPTEIATDPEAASFAGRIAQLLLSNNLRSISPLFVKVIYSPSLTEAELQAVEYFVNRVYSPICGRR